MQLPKAKRAEPETRRAPVAQRPPQNLFPILAAKNSTAAQNSLVLFWRRMGYERRTCNAVLGAVFEAVDGAVLVINLVNFHLDVRIDRLSVFIETFYLSTVVGVIDDNCSP